MKKENPILEESRNHARWLIAERTKWEAALETVDESIPFTRDDIKARIESINDELNVTYYSLVGN